MVTKKISVALASDQRSSTRDFMASQPSRLRLLYTIRDQDWENTKSLGILNYSLAVLEGLAQRTDVVVDILANASIASRLPAAVPHFRSHLNDRPAPRGWARVLWDQWQLCAWVGRLRPDWLMLPKGFTPLFRRPAARVSALVHDDLLSYYKSAGDNPFPKSERIYFRRSLYRTAMLADAIVTPSTAAACDVAAHYRCRATPLAIGAPVSGIRHPIRADARPEHFLILTSRYPHKLTAQAIEWMARFAAEDGSDIRVTGVGSLPAGATWPDLPGWSHLGRLQEEEYQRVRAMCGTLVFFSAYEGFGLPPTEALRDGQRVAASDIPAHREHLPEWLLFDNVDYTNFRAVLRRVLGQPAPAVSVDTGAIVASRWIDLLRSK